MKLKRYETGQVQLRGSTTIMGVLYRVAIEIKPPPAEQEATVCDQAIFCLVGAVEVVGNLSKGPSALRLVAALQAARREIPVRVLRIIVKGPDEMAEWQSTEDA